MLQAFLPKFKTERDMLKNNLRRHKHLIHEGGSLLQLQHGKSQFQELFRQLKVDREEAWERGRLARDASDRQRRASVSACLQSPDNLFAHEGHVAARSWSPRTCRWILNDNNIASWLDPLCCQDPLLWMHGKPGAGKTI